MSETKTPERCPICDFPMAETVDKGCVPGSCSYRPEEGSAEYRRIAERKRSLAQPTANKPTVWLHPPNVVQGPIPDHLPDLWQTQPAAQAPPEPQKTTLQLHSLWLQQSPEYFNTLGKKHPGEDWLEVCECDFADYVAAERVSAALKEIERLRKLARVSAALKEIEGRVEALEKRETPPKEAKV
jgi:hypothetical protein